jgi:hypothetical protein
VAPKKFDGYDIHVLRNPCVYSERKNPTEIIRCNIAFGMMNDNKLRVIKNRFSGIVGAIDLNQTIELFAGLIATIKFDGRMDLFHEGMRKQLIENITSIVNAENFEKGE